MNKDFYPVDLGEWLELCARAGVPAVPAVEIARAPTLMIEDIETVPMPAPVVDFWNKIVWTQGTMNHGYMLRWSCGSMSVVKERLSVGLPGWHSDLMSLSPDDFRASQLIEDFNRQTIAAYLRPWLAFDMHEGWPIEYRAYVRDDEIIGISNYYPQRPLPDNEATAADLKTVRLLTERLIAVQTLPTYCPWVARDFDMSKNQFTADFARLPSGAILFLEGGPPHGKSWGAHQCCFRNNEIDGVALFDRNGVTP